MTKQEKQIQNFITALGITKEEAEELLKYDEKVDKGEKTEYDLTKEQEKQIRKDWIATTSEKKAKKDDKRGKNKPVNEEKEQIISILCDFLQNQVEIDLKNIEIVNKNRQISFKSGDKSFDLTLIQKRNAKK